MPDIAVQRSAKLGGQARESKKKKKKKKEREREREREKEKKMKGTKSGKRKNRRNRKREKNKGTKSGKRKNRKKEKKTKEKKKGTKSGKKKGTKSGKKTYGTERRTPFRSSFLVCQKKSLALPSPLPLNPSPSWNPWNADKFSVIPQFPCNLLHDFLNKVCSSSATLKNLRVSI